MTGTLLPAYKVMQVMLKSISLVWNIVNDRNFASCLYFGGDTLELHDCFILNVNKFCVVLCYAD